MTVDDKFTSRTSAATDFYPFDFSQRTIVYNDCSIVHLAADDDKYQWSSGGHVPAPNRQQTSGSENHSNGSIVPLLKWSRTCDPADNKMAMAETIRAR